MEDFNNCAGSAIPAFICLAMLLAIPWISAIRSQRIVRMFLLCCPCPLVVWLMLWQVDDWGFRRMWGSAPLYGFGCLAWFLICFATINKWETKRYLHRLALLVVFVGPLLFVEFMGWALSGEWYLSVARSIEEDQRMLIQETSSGSAKESKQSAAKKTTPNRRALPTLSQP